MKYSVEATTHFAESIDKSAYLTDLNILISKEGCSTPIFIQGEIVLDMDAVERFIANEENRNVRKSMDAACVITNSEHIIQKVLLVEFRFNYANMRNLKKDDLEGKVDGSLSIIDLENALPVHEKYFFIFNSNIKQQAIHRFSRFNPRLPNNFIATDIHEFKALFFEDIL